MTGFTVQPESFEPAGNQLRDVAGQISAAWAPVKAQSEAVKFGRGDDMISPLIQVSLQAAIELVDSSLRTSGQALHGYADGLRNMGHTYRSTEDATTPLFRAR